MRSVPLGLSDTRVSFPDGSTEGVARVVGTVDVPGGHGVITDATPFHPVDHSWPDQPGDTGSLAGVRVIDTVTGCVDAQGGLTVAEEVEARRGDQGHIWVVVHVVPAGAAVPTVGAEVELVVDRTRRERLSAAHTACHLAAFALNAETVGLWRKEPDRRDSLGSPDFDQIALQTSRIDEGGSDDVYRIGKSLRKRGMDTAGLLSGVEELAAAVNDRLRGWVATDSPVRVEAESPTLAAVRRWVTELPEGEASVRCGGTHLSHLGELASVTVDYRVQEEGAALVVRTQPTLI